jgi:sugar lactone lactonase YvrE
MRAVVRNVHTHALVIGSDGAIYGTHVDVSTSERSVWRLDLEGRKTEIVTTTQAGSLNLQPFLIASDGAVYSVSAFQHERAPEARELFLLRRTAAGVVDTIAGGLSGHADGEGRSARFTSIDGMAWAPDSTIVLVDGARVRRVDRTGVVQTLTRELTERDWDQDLMGVSVDADGTIYVADFAAHRVLRVTGDKHTVVARSGSWWSITGVTSTGDGLYTLEHPHAPFGILGDLKVGPYIRVRHISPDGSSRVVAQRSGDRTRTAAVITGGVALLVVSLFLWRRW